MILKGSVVRAFEEAQRIRSAIKQYSLKATFDLTRGKMVRGFKVIKALLILCTKEDLLVCLAESRKESSKRVATRAT